MTDDDWHRWKHDGAKPSPLARLNAREPHSKSPPPRVSVARLIAAGGADLALVARVLDWISLHDRTIGLWEAMSYGERKYARYSWRLVPGGVERYTDAMLRHFLWHDYYGEPLDTETGLPHDAHAAACAAIVADILSRE